MNIYIPEDIWNIIKDYMIDWKLSHKKKFIPILNLFLNTTSGILIKYPLFIDNDPNPDRFLYKNLLKYSIKKHNILLNKYFYETNYSYLTRNEWYVLCMNLNRINTGW